MDIIASAGDIARKAGQLVREYSQKRDLLIREKGSSYDFVTEADLASQNMIKKCVAELGGNNRVIGEEDGISDEAIIREIRNNSKGSKLWLVDPLDGTVNYIRGLLGYGVSIAVFDGSEVVAGAIYQPDVDALYLAEPGSGAACNGNKLKVSQYGNLNQCIGSTHIPVIDMNWRQHTNLWNEAVCAECQNLRMLGASIYEQTRIASGGLDFYYEIGPHPWDLAAGELLIREAGGIVTQLNGQPFNYGVGGVIAASAAIHDKVVRMLSKADPQINELC